MSLNIAGDSILEVIWMKGVNMSENVKFTYCDIPEQVKNIWIDRINELNSKKIIQKELEESVEWGRRY